MTFTFSIVISMTVGTMIVNYFHQVKIWHLVQLKSSTLIFLVILFLAPHCRTVINGQWERPASLAVS